MDLGEQSPDTHSDSDRESVNSDESKSNEVSSMSPTLIRGGSDGKPPTCCERLTTKPKNCPALEVSSLFIFPGDWIPRTFIYHVTRHKIFESVVIGFIVINCIFLAIADPTQAEPPPYQEYTDVVFTVVFSLEMVLKIFAYGFILHQGSYLRTGWNVLDFVIVLLSYLNYIPGVGNYTALRSLRVLRPLRSMNAVPELRAIVQGLLKSVIGLTHVFVLLAFLFGIFGILGLQLMMGLYRMRCVDISTNTTHWDLYCKYDGLPGGDAQYDNWLGFTCPSETMKCKSMPANPLDLYRGYFHFDNIGNSCLVLFSLMTFEDWTTELEIAYDLVGTPMFLFFVVFLLMGSYFIPNLSLAVINEKFVEAQAEANRAAEEAAFLAAEEARKEFVAEHANVRGEAEFDNGVVVLDEEDEAHLASSLHRKSDSSACMARIDALRDILHEQIEGYPRPPPFPLCTGKIVRSRIFSERDSFANSAKPTAFQYFIIACIVLNTAILAAQHRDQPDWVTSMNDIGNKVLTSIFCFEFALKLLVMGPLWYAFDPFNVMDGTVVTVSIIELALAGSSTVSVFRALRLLRVLKFLKSVQSLRTIIRVMLAAVRNTGYLNLIMLLYMFIAALMGMAFFGGLYRQLETPDYTVRSTWDNFYWAFLTVFQILTRDNWMTVMVNGADVTHPLAILFFIVLVLIGDFLILNLFLAILIGAFEEDREDHVTTETVVSTEDSPSTSPYGSVKGSMSPQFSSTFVLNESASLKKSKTKTTRSGSMMNLSNDIRAEEVIRIGAQMAQEIRRAQRLTQNKSIFGYKPMVVLQSNSKATAGASARRSPGSVAFDESNEGHPLDYSHLAADADFGDLVTPSRLDGNPISEVIVHNASNSFGTHGDGLGLTAQESLTIDLDDGIATSSKNRDRLYSLFADAEDQKLSREIPGQSIRCLRCKELQQVPFETAPLVPEISQQQLHSRMCESIQVRVAKEKVLTKLVRYIDHQLREKAEVTEEKFETLIGQAWASGLLLSESIEGFGAGDPTHQEIWGRLRAALLEEQTVLDLRVGEEQVGRSLLAYVAAKVPKDHQTNGGYALGLFGPTNAFRVFISELVQHSVWDQVILVCIIISSLLLIVDNPKYDQPDAQELTLDIFDSIFTFIFTIELMCKVIALGFIQAPGSYIRNPWNILDCVIVIVSLISFGGREASRAGVGSGAPDISFLKVLRTLRTLRPLRVITRNRGLKIVVMALIASIKGIANVAMIAMFNYLIFGILAVQLFSGILNSCTDTTITDAWNCTGNFTDPNSGQAQQRVWYTHQRNYDNIGNAMLTLIEVSSMEWWIDHLYDVIDGVSEVSAGTRDYSPARGLFFIAFIVIASFFILNMFVGVVITNFNDAKDDMDGVSVLTEEQRKWVEIQRVMLNFRPKPLMTHGKSFISWAAYKVAEDNRFQMVIAVCIILNVVVLAMDFHDAPQAYADTLGYLNDAFSWVFVVEAIVKLTAFRLSYFYDGWNQFDLFLVIVAQVGFIIKYSTEGLAFDISVLLVFRVFRIFRILRLIRSAKRVRLLLETLWYSLPSLGNIGGFVLLLFFIYGILGVQLFYNIDSGNRVDSKYTNFFNFFNAVGILFRIMTVTDWNQIMHDCMAQPPFCDPSTNCGSPAAPLYFLSFLVLAAFVFTNLFIAVILDNFETTMRLDKSSSKEVNITHLQKFIALWPDYDPDGTMVIPTFRLETLLTRLGPPLGLARSGSRSALLETASQYRIPEHGGYIHFVETLIPIARKSMGVKLSLRDIREHEEQWKQNFDELAALPTLRYQSEVISVQLYFASTYIQSAHRRYMAKRAVAKLRQEKKTVIENWMKMQKNAVEQSLFRRPSSGGMRISTGNGSLSSYSQGHQPLNPFLPPGIFETQSSPTSGRRSPLTPKSRSFNAPESAQSRSPLEKPPVVPAGPLPLGNGNTDGVTLLPRRSRANSAISPNGTGALNLPSHNSFRRQETLPPRAEDYPVASTDRHFAQGSSDSPNGAHSGSASVESPVESK